MVIEIHVNRVDGFFWGFICCLLTRGDDKGKQMKHAGGGVVLHWFLFYVVWDTMMDCMRKKDTEMISVEMAKHC